MKIIPVGAKLSYADERTDVTEIIVALRSFANDPEKKWSIIMIHCEIFSLFFERRHHDVLINVI